MVECWNTAEDKRPTFKEIFLRLQDEIKRYFPDESFATDHTIVSLNNERNQNYQSFTQSNNDDNNNNNYLGLVKK